MPTYRLVYQLNDSTSIPTGTIRYMQRCNVVIVHFELFQIIETSGRFCTCASFSYISKAQQGAHEAHDEPLRKIGVHQT